MVLSQPSRVVVRCLDDGLEQVGLEVANVTLKLLGDELVR
jgi:hypothetical protein